MIGATAVHDVTTMLDDETMGDEADVDDGCVRFFFCLLVVTEIVIFAAVCCCS